MSLLSIRAILSRPAATRTSATYLQTWTSNDQKESSPIFEPKFHTAHTILGVEAGASMEEAYKGAVSRRLRCSACQMGCVSQRR